MERRKTKQIKKKQQNKGKHRDVQLLKYSFLFILLFVISVYVCKCARMCAYRSKVYSFHPGFQGLNLGHHWPEMSVFVSCVKEAVRKHFFGGKKSLFGTKDQLPNSTQNFIQLDALNPGCKVKNSSNNFKIKEKKKEHLGPGLVVHIFNLITGEAEACRSLSSRPICSTQ